METGIKAVVLAAGKGTRLRTEGVDLPKVLRQARGRALLDYVLSELSFLPREDLEAFCSALERALTTIHTCPECGLLIDGDSCPICSDSTRDVSTLMVVTSAKDVLAIENSDSFRGRYFVLNGTLSPAAHRTLESTGINRLLAKVQAGGIREVICCTGADRRKKQNRIVG